MQPASASLPRPSCLLEVTRDFMKRSIRPSNYTFDIYSALARRNMFDATQPLSAKPGSPGNRDLRSRAPTRICRACSAARPSHSPSPSARRIAKGVIVSGWVAANVFGIKHFEVLSAYFSEPRIQPATRVCGATDSAFADKPGDRDTALAEAEVCIVQRSYRRAICMKRSSSVERSNRKTLAAVAVGTPNSLN